MDFALDSEWEVESNEVKNKLSLLQEKGKLMKACGMFSFDRSQTNFFFFKARDVFFFHRYQSMVHIPSSKQQHDISS